MNDRPDPDSAEGDEAARPTEADSRKALKALRRSHAKEVAAHERAAARATLALEKSTAKLAVERKASAAKLEREREASAAKLASLREASSAEREGLVDELKNLRGSYHLSGVAKKLDLRELDGFAPIARETVNAGRTGMDYDRLYTLWQAVRAAPPDHPVIEVGSYHGGSAHFIGRALQAHDRTPRFFVCDTFAGHAETDARIDIAHHDAGKFEDASAEATAAYLASYPALELVVGDIVETSQRLPAASFGLVHLDVDVYPTTRYCLRHFGTRLAENAIVVIDDYGVTTCPGVKQAADEFVVEFPHFRLWHLLTGQAILSRSTSGP